MLSQNLEKTLHRAMTFAADRGSELVTLEHLLFALVDDKKIIFGGLDVYEKEPPIVDEFFSNSNNCFFVSSIMLLDDFIIYFRIFKLNLNSFIFI